MANHKKHIAGRGGASILGELERRRVAWAVELEGLRGKVQSAIDTAGELLAAAEIDQSAIPDLSAQADSMITAVQHQYSKLLKTYDIAEQDKESYRLNHMISRNPQRPFVLLETLKMGAMLVFETIANAGFFAQAHMVATPTAALTLSALISMANISASCLGGFFIERYTHYGAHAANPDAPEFKTVRIRAKALRLGFTGLMSGFTLSIGLVRVQETLIIEHSLSAYADLLTHIEAGLLMLTSACISVFTYFKARRAFADEYPGYSKRQAALDEAQDALLECQETWADNIEAIFDDQIEAVEQQEKRAAKAHKKRDKAIANAHAQYRHLEKHAAIAGQTLRGECAQLISEFKSRGGKIETAFDLEAHCSFQSVLAGLSLPEPVADNHAQDALHDLKLNKAIALERLSRIFTQ